MNNSAELKLYLVTNGEAFPTSEAPDLEEAGALLVAATTPEDALRVADAFDNGQVEAEEMTWQGRTISVVKQRDAEISR